MQLWRTPHPIQHNQIFCPAVSLSLSSLTLDTTGDGRGPNQVGGKDPLWSTYGSNEVAEQPHIRREDHWWRVVVGRRGAEHVRFCMMTTRRLVMSYSAQVTAGPVRRNHLGRVLGMPRASDQLAHCMFDCFGLHLSPPLKLFPTPKMVEAVCFGLGEAGLCLARRLCLTFSITHSLPLTDLAIQVIWL